MRPCRKRSDPTNSGPTCGSSPVLVGAVGLSPAANDPQPQRRSRGAHCRPTEVAPVSEDRSTTRAGRTFKGLLVTAHMRDGVLPQVLLSSGWASCPGVA